MLSDPVEEGPLPNPRDERARRAEFGAGWAEFGARRAEFRARWAEIAPIGRDPVTGGYLRYGFSEPVRRLEDWFRTSGAEGANVVESDGNGNLFAWYGPPPDSGDAVLLGSHFDSVPYGGGYDGPLGIVSAFLAIRELRERGRDFRRPVGVAAFAEEEGARFGVPCLGSRLFTGALDADRAGALTDRDGVTLAEAMGGRPAGTKPRTLRRIGAFVELHIEQGRALADLGAPVGVASGIWPHGRWRLDFSGEPNHAGTTRMADRRDPMLTCAFTVLAANKEARRRGGHATVGRVEVEPNATNAIPTLVRGWLDARAADAAVLDALVEAVREKAVERATRDGTTVTLTQESSSPPVAFDGDLITLFRRVLKNSLTTSVTDGQAGGLGGGLGDALRNGLPVLPTAAGHDAGVLSAHVPTAMLFVRNPTGVSHSPAESASDDDCSDGVRRLADLLEELACE